MNKFAYIDCNSKFILIEGRYWWGFYSTTFEDSRFYLDINTSNEEIGNKCFAAYEKNKECTREEGEKIFAETASKERAEKKLQFELEKYGYKDEKSLYKNRMCCSTSFVDQIITITPSDRKKFNYYEKYGDYGIVRLKPDTPPELLGAAVRYAFTRCKGRGLDVVTKALFPDGVPNSLEEYLESIDPDYKKWLISA